MPKTGQDEPCGAESSLARQRDQARADRRRELWSDDVDQQMARLAWSFPALRRADGIGEHDWDREAFLRWLVSSAPTACAWHAGRFVLSVWSSSTNWNAIARAENEELVEDDPDLDLRFDLVLAMATWDDEHRAAFAQWIQVPFFP